MVSQNDTWGCAMGLMKEFADNYEGIAGPTPSKQKRLKFMAGFLPIDQRSAEWSFEIFSPVGSTGATGQRIKFNRLGAERRGLGEDRIFELSSTDAFKVALLEAVIG